MTWKKTGAAVVLTAVLYLAVLYFTGEFHLASSAFKFFAILWLVQSMMMLLQAWGHSQRVTSVGASATDDIPPAG